MDLFYATCAAGLEGPASAVARRQLPAFTEERRMSGAVLFRCAVRQPRIAVFQNCFLVLSQWKGDAPIARAAARFARDADALHRTDAAMRRYGFTSFRVMFSDCNRPAPAERNARAAIEQAVRCARADRVSPQTEILVLRRSEGLTLLLLRLSAMGTAAPERGELSPALAACMVELCGPRPDGAFLDPFAGHGALGLARIQAGPFSRVLLSDADPAMVSAMQGRPRLAKAEITLRDALALQGKLPEGCVTEIATDPPWGLFRPLPVPAVDFYRGMLSGFAHVLAPGGKACILTAAKRELEEAAEAFQAELRFLPRIDVLVHGKKAALFCAERR